ncbi:MAG: hypothetical protein O2954_05520 [bacterium]|nr:hypothetical protein [bacterium]
MATAWKPEPELLNSLDSAIPDILASQKENGQFGTEPWISTDQNLLFPLAAAWSLKSSKYYHDDTVLDAIVRGGYAMIEGQDENGMYLFKKKDYSTWGQIFQPWCYSRWIRARWLVGDAMPADARERWDAALQLGYRGISDRAMSRVHNIPCHHSMGLYCAGLVFGREDWKAQSKAFMQQVMDEQSPNGWWPEHKGPVVSYNFVYSEALGAYYSMSGDKDVLEAIDRAAVYHANLTYPDGSSVETVDGRNPYHEGLRLRGTGFCHSATGRGYLARQHAVHLKTGKPFPADYAAHLLIHGEEGPAEKVAADADIRMWRMGDEAVTVRKRPWFFCLSAFLAELPQNRWGQDRQNFVSVFHDQVGLIVGGGNTKLQPLWSNFTVGNQSLLKHTPGEEEPDFSAREGLLHVPDDAKYEADEDAGQLVLKYGPETCKITVRPETDTALTLVCEATSTSGEPVYGHLTLIPHIAEKAATADVNTPKVPLPPRTGGKVQFASGEEVELGDEPFEKTGEAWVEHAGWRLSLPEGSRVVWPALPHNPYRKAGESTAEEGRIVVELPFSEAVSQHELTVTIL